MDFVASSKSGKNFVIRLFIFLSNPKRIWFRSITPQTKLFYQNYELIIDENRIIFAACRPRVCIDLLFVRRGVELRSYGTVNTESISTR